MGRNKSVRDSLENNLSVDQQRLDLKNIKIYDIMIERWP